jgi:hypothetical protein
MTHLSFAIILTKRDRIEEAVRQLAASDGQLDRIAGRLAVQEADF